jgi:hypothetical protein
MRSRRPLLSLKKQCKLFTDSSCGTEDRKLYNGEKWWLQGIPKEELIKLVDDEDDGEPEIYM